MGTTTVTSNPILLAMAALDNGQSIDDLMALRDQQLPSPQSWLDAGWDALAHMKENEECAQWVSQVMRCAWGAAGPVGRCARVAWANQPTTGAQVLWQRTYEAITKGNT